MDTIQEDTLRAQRAAEERLKTQEATLPGLPPPADPTWLEAQLKDAHSSPHTTPVRQHLPSGGDRVLQPRRYSQETSVPSRRRGTIVNEMETRLGSGHWEEVYQAFQHSGSEKAIAGSVGLTEDEVYYLLDTGIRRLRLPAIRDHAINDAEVQLQLDKRAPDLCNAINPELDIAEVQQAATKRAVEDAMVAAHTLELSATVGGMIEGWASHMKDLMAQGAFSHPHQVTPDLIMALTKALEMHTRATERATKLYRLTRGEPTENIVHQVAGLLVGVSLEELKEADKRGALPASLLAKFGAQIIDMPEESVTLVEPPPDGDEDGDEDEDESGD